MAEQLTRQYSDQLPGARPIFRCHYEVLGVSVDAKGSEITAAYRRAQLKWHPDKNPDNQMEASARCKEIVRAYNVLSDCKGAKPGYKKWYDANKDRLLKHQGRLEILYEFGRIATDPDEATKYFSEAIELCRNGDPEDLAKLYAGRAWAKFRRSIQNANNSGDWQKDMKKAFSTSPHSHHVLLFSARICNLKKNFRIAQDECMEGLTNYTFISSLQQEDDIIKDFEEQLNIALDGQGHQIDEPLRTYWQACVREIRKQKEQREVQKQKKQIIWGFVSVVALNILCIALLYLAICEGWVRLRYLEQMARRLRKPPTKHLAAASLFGAPSKTLHEFKVDFDDSQAVFQYPLAKFSKVILFYSSELCKPQSCDFIQPYRKVVDRVHSAVKFFSIDCHFYDCSLKRFKTLKAGSSKKVTTFPTIIGLEPGNQVSKAYEETNVTAEALEKWVTGMVRHHVLTVTSTNCDERGGIFDPKTDPEYVALLFHKHHIPPLVWSGLSITYMGVLRIGQVRQSEKVLVNRFNVVEFPSVVVIKRPASSRGQWIVKLFDLPPLPSAPRCREEENGRCSTPEAEERQRAAELLLQEYGKLKAFLDGFARKNKDAREYRKDYEKFMKDMKPSQED